MESVGKLSLLFGFYLISSCFGSCPTFWTSFEGSCYVLIHNPSSWADANVICKDRQSNLVEIGSIAENNFVKALIRTQAPTAEDVWTGGNDLTDRGDWIWEGSQEKFTVTDWYPGEPNNVKGVENCVELWKKYNFRWNDRECSLARPFICEKEESGSFVG